MANGLLMAFSQLTLVVGRLTPNGVQMLGTCFLVNADGMVATTFHSIGPEANNLVVLMPNQANPNEYQDMSDTSCQLLSASVCEIDPVRDVAILRTELKWSAQLPRLTGFDAVTLGSSVNIYGYPHCTHNRRAFTFQATEIGAKTLMDIEGIKSKHAVINTQARPGQSGSPIVDPRTGDIMGMLVGAWVPGPGGIQLGEINPYELHQTTQCISSFHILEMI